MKKINIIKENKTFNQIINLNKCVKDKNFIIYYNYNPIKFYQNHVMNNDNPQLISCLLFLIILN